MACATLTATLCTGCGCDPLTAGLVVGGGLYVLNELGSQRQVVGTLPDRPPATSQSDDSRETAEPHTGVVTTRSPSGPTPSAVKATPRKKTVRPRPAPPRSAPKSETNERPADDGKRKDQRLRHPEKLHVKHVPKSVKQALTHLGNGLHAYRNGQYREAECSLKQALQNPGLPRAEKVQALTYVSASLYWLDERSQAAAYLRRLFRLCPDAVVSGRVLPPSFRDFARKVREQHKGG